MATTTALRLEGKDALALLNNIGTQKLDDLTPGHARATLFCDFKGRLQHRAIVAMTNDGAVWMLRDDAPGAELAAFVDKHIFREDVRIEDRSEALPVSLVHGVDALAIGSVDEKSALPGRVRIDEAHVLTVGGAWVPHSELDRVREGRPAHGHEIVDSFTPFEVGLAHDVHLDKGCFTGQEVLMRLVTYQSVKRRLARVAGGGAPPATPADLRDGDQPAGVVTTAVADGGGWIGLAVVRNEPFDASRSLALAGGGEVRVEPLPLTRALGRP